MNLGWHKPTPHVTNSSGLNGTTPLRPPVTITATFTPATLPPEISPPDDNFQCTLEINPIYAVTSSIISFYFPCVIMLIIYIRLYMEARRHVKSVREMAHVVYYKNSSSSTRNGRTPSRSAASDAVSSVQSRMVSEHKAAVTLGIIVSVFLICWAPFFAINIIHANCRCISIITFKALTWLGYCKLINFANIYEWSNYHSVEISTINELCQCKLALTQFTWLNLPFSGLEHSTTWTWTWPSRARGVCSSPLFTAETVV